MLIEDAAKQACVLSAQAWAFCCSLNSVKAAAVSAAKDLIHILYLSKIKQ